MPAQYQVLDSTDSGEFVCATGVRMVALTPFR